MAAPRRGSSVEFGGSEVVAELPLAGRAGSPSFAESSHPSTESNVSVPKETKPSLQRRMSKTINRALSKMSKASGFSGGRTPSLGQRSSRSLEIVSVTSKSSLVKPESVRQLATFANTLAMQDHDISLMFPDDPVNSMTWSESPPGESGTSRLKRALSTETKRTGRNVERLARNMLHETGVESSTLVRVAMEDNWQILSCASLPFTVVLFLVFTVFFQLHYNITDIFLTERSIRHELGGTAEMITDAASIYDWLEESCLPFLWAGQHDGPPALNEEEMLVFHRLIGGIKVVTTRAQAEPCDHADLVGDIRCSSKVVDASAGSAIFGGRRLAPRALPDGAAAETLPAGSVPRGASRGTPQPRGRGGGRYSTGAQQPAWAGAPRSPRQRLRSPGALEAFRRAWQERRLRLNRPEIRSFTPRKSDGNVSEIVLPVSLTLPEALAEVAGWREQAVITKTTLTFSIELLILSNKLGTTGLLSHVAMDFSVHRAGETFVELKVLTFILQAISSDKLESCAAVLWLICLAAFSMQILQRSCIMWKQGSFRKHIFHFWNLVAYFVNMWGWVLLALFCTERAFVWELKEAVDNYKVKRSKLPPWEHHDLDMKAVADLLRKSEGLVDLARVVQIFVSLYQIVLVLRFFLSTRGQPRLAVVLVTIQRASVDLFHLLIVFIVIFLGYVVSGHILFGRRLEEFATFEASFAMCLEIVIERQYQWDRFSDVDQWTVTLWTWTFLVLLILVLVNIFLAMIFETYNEVRASLGNGMSLFETGRHLVKNVQLMFVDTNWVANDDIVATVKGMHTNHITVWMLRDAFPNISQQQLQYLFRLANRRVEHIVLRSQQRGDLLSMVGGMYLASESLQTEIGTFCGQMERRGAEARDKKEQQANERPLDPPADVPTWLRVQLVPHFQKQKHLLAQVKLQVQRISQDLHLRGMEARLPAGERPLMANIQAPSAPPSPLSWNGSTYKGVTPATARSGLTRSSYQPPKPTTPSLFSTPRGLLVKPHTPRPLLEPQTPREEPGAGATGVGVGPGIRAEPLRAAATAAEETAGGRS